MESRFGRKPLSSTVETGWRRALFAGAALAALAAPLAGCGVNRVVPDEDRTSDARLRHPIALVEQPYALDVFPARASGQLDAHTQNQIATFASRYRLVGSGTISMIVPQAGQRQLVDGRVLDQIRHELARHGAQAPVAVSHYPIQNPALASPVRLSFDGLKAAVTHRCGDWPSDLASASSTRGWENKPYWNFGCASQAMLAAQVADPRDVAEPQGETPADGAVRIRGINNVRKGTDPSTGWTTKNSNIGGVGN
jgi:pilus assembly protein CpaD